ncbi:MAG: hypothetical protein A2Y07_11280 [Planctomycetes bacterium GWF2_50_10]|nr:MAG: hypothetical protein A2Y07_11280 [Planctomycetes bacterium GWF2_50_10]
MKVKVATIVLIAAVLLTSFSGCTRPKKKGGLDYNKQLPPGQLALRKITDPNELPDFTAACSDLTRLREAIQRSASYMAKPSSKAFYPYGEVTHQQVQQTLAAFEELIDSGMTPEQMNEHIRTNYDCYISVGCDDMGTVLYTGYYTPIFNGSLQRTERFKYPLYSVPEDLVKGPDGTILGKRNADGSFTQYASRSDIENSGALAGKEIIWLEDKFEVYIAHVQGSAKIRLPDGTLQGIGYNANNGWDYSSVSRQLIAEGKLTQEQLSLKGMIEYFKAHPDEVDTYVNQNPRFVFFQFEKGDPRGSLNEPVTPFRTIATDKAIYPRASIAMVQADLEPSIGWTCDQDTGGAIRAAGRCDIYMGIGDQAGELAGRTYKEGKLYYIFLKPGANTSPAATDQASSNQ